MRSDEIRRRSRWMLRAQEWDEPRARYPNIWHAGMPRQILAYETMVSRMRLGDLVAIYYPSSQRHPERSERIMGISRVVGLRGAHDPAYAWIELETAHRFDRPQSLGQSPRRVFLCCDPGWPEKDVALFQKVFDAAVAAGWEPAPGETEEGRPPIRPAGAQEVEAPQEREAPEVEASAEAEPEKPSPTEAAEVPAEEEAPPRPSAPEARLFAGAAYSGDMRDPRDGSWLAFLELENDHLKLIRLEPTGRSGLRGLLRDPDGTMMQVEAIGLGFPFSLPLPFAERLLGGPFPEEGWWALARRLERVTLPEYLVALQEFRDAQGEIKRYTDEAAGAPSPLHRSGPDLGSMAYHGIKMICEGRSRYAIRPFERARGKLLLEVCPTEATRRLSTGSSGGNRAATISTLTGSSQLPLKIEDRLRRKCLSWPQALDAVVSARSAVVAVVRGESEKSPEDLGLEEADRIRREGWIYGLD